MTEQNFFRRFEPAVPKIFHYSIAGLIWIGVGAMLIVFASEWLHDATEQPLWLIILMILTGLILASLIFLFGFSKIVKKNIKRIVSKPEKFCVFAFISWSSYLIILVMVSLGIFLRNSPIPKHFLAAVYIGIGGGLVFSSSGYFIKIYKEIKGKKEEE
ncbi:MAG: hypothetical protein ACTSQC_11985 [Candidatus Heimdallarchaeaceae archaeon]